jgi:hypothetical protein
MEIGEFREEAAKMELPQAMVESLIADFIRDSKKGVAVPLDEVLEMAKKTYPDGFVDPTPYPPFVGSS